MMKSCVILFWTESIKNSMRRVRLSILNNYQQNLSELHKKLSKSQKKLETVWNIPLKFEFSSFYLEISYDIYFCV